MRNAGTPALGRLRIAHESRSDLIAKHAYLSDGTKALVVLMAALNLYFEGFVLVICGGLFLLRSKPTYTVVIMTTNGKEFGRFKTTDRAEAADRGRFELSD